MRTPIVVTALLGAILIAACGDSDSGTKTVVENRTTTVTRTETAPATTPSEPRSYEFFQSPSKNIGCAATDEDVVQVRCDIRDHDWKPPAKPSDCELDYGSGLVIEAGGSAEFVCAGDTTLANGPVLEYGETNKIGSISCKSTEAAITCADDETGRGFSLSRQSYKLL